MAQRLFLAVFLIVCLAPSIHTTSHLQFANGTGVNVTRTGCGKTKFCLEDPEDCDPAAGSCLFGSIRAGPVEAPDGSALSITLRGESNKYVALGVTANQSEGTTTVFVCGQTNGSFRFFAAEHNNSDSDGGVLTVSGTPVEDIQGQVIGSTVQCSFTVPDVIATTTGDTHVAAFIVELGTGVINGNKLGPFSLVKMGGPLDLVNPTNNDNTSVTVDNTSVTVDNTSVTVDNTSVTVDNTSVTVESVTPTVNNATTPVNNATTPVNNATTPVNNATTPVNNATTPVNNATTPVNNATTPVNNATTPVNNATTPVNNATIPMISTTTPIGMTSIQNISGTFSSTASLLLWSFLTWLALQRM